MPKTIAQPAMQTADRIRISRFSLRDTKGSKRIANPLLCRIDKGCPLFRPDTLDGNGNNGQQFRRVDFYVIGQIVKL